MQRGDLNAEVAKALHQIMTLDRRLRSSQEHEQRASQRELVTLVLGTPTPLVMDMAMLTLTDAFQASTSNNYIRFQILQIVQQLQYHLHKLFSLDETARRVTSVLTSNDPMARALALQLLVVLAPVLKDQDQVQAALQERVTFTSDPVEWSSVIAACSAFGKVDEMPRLWWSALLQKCRDSSLDENIHLQLLSLLQFVIHPEAYILLEKLLVSSAKKQKSILLTMTLIVMKLKREDLILHHFQLLLHFYHVWTRPVLFCLVKLSRFLSENLLIQLSSIAFVEDSNKFTQRLRLLLSRAILDVSRDTQFPIRNWLELSRRADCRPLQKAAIFNLIKWVKWQPLKRKKVIGFWLNCLKESPDVILGMALMEFCQKDEIPSVIATLLPFRHDSIIAQIIYKMSIKVPLRTLATLPNEVDHVSLRLAWTCLPVCSHQERLLIHSTSTEFICQQKGDLWKVYSLTRLAWRHGLFCSRSIELCLEQVKHERFYCWLQTLHFLSKAEESLLTGNVESSMNFLLLAEKTLFVNAFQRRWIRSRFLYISLVRDTQTTLKMRHAVLMAALAERWQQLALFMTQLAEWNCDMDLASISLIESLNALCLAMSQLLLDRPICTKTNHPLIEKLSLNENMCSVLLLPCLPLPRYFEQQSPLFQIHWTWTPHQDWILERDSPLLVKCEGIIQDKRKDPQRPIVRIEWHIYEKERKRDFISEPLGDYVCCQFAVKETGTLRIESFAVDKNEKLWRLDSWQFHIK